ncbi:hypothetical protein [Legionella israelensis]|uniref:hypothetical protein n=1 Tax=Legionella israelensis TaxID=454 RepID=UPI0014300B37|nr:hypothetical protein [Legionella israelensis]
MQYQMLLKAVQEAIADNDMTQLLDLTSKDWVMIYLHTEEIFLNSFTVAMNYYSSYDHERILNLNFPIKETSASCTGYNTGEKLHYSLETNYEQGLDDSSMWPLFFYRTQYKNGKLCEHYELLQNFVHISGIFLNDRDGTYSLINEEGDTQVKVVTILDSGIKMILVERKALDYYLGYSNNFFVRFFDLKKLGEKQSWKIESFETSHIKRRIYIEDEQKRCKGAETILPVHTIEQIEMGEQKKYESFTIYDFKHEQIVECSSDPKALDNYFKDTGKPFEMSPVFFKPEVLSEYKNNPEKYVVNERNIKCYGAWSLKTYSINEEGQVHTYIYYLGQLPHKEQLHWKKYNEDPKAEISEVAYNTDFLAEFDEEECPLKEIKKQLLNFPPYVANENEYIIWKPKGGSIDTLFNQTHPVITDINRDYKDFLLSLCVLMIDGLQEKTIRNLAQADKDAKSLACLEMLLNKWGSEHTKTILEAMRKLQRKRSKFVGHGGGVIDFDIKESALSLSKELSRALSLLTSEIIKNSENKLS